MTEKQALCPHMNFEAHVQVDRIIDIGRFTADVTVKCDVCGLPFSFVGMPAGFSYEHPMVSVDATEARLPIRPGPGGIIEALWHAGWPRPEDREQPAGQEPAPASDDEIPAAPPEATTAPDYTLDAAITEALELARIAPDPDIAYRLRMVAEACAAARTITADAVNTLTELLEHPERPVKKVVTRVIDRLKLARRRSQ